VSDSTLCVVDKDKAVRAIAADSATARTQLPGDRFLF